MNNGILIIGIVRSGTSNLLNAIGSYYNRKTIFEPLTPSFRTEFTENDIVKIVIQNQSLEEHIKLSKKFSKTILLDRRDIEGQINSYLNLWKVNNGKWNMPYFSKKFSYEEINLVRDKFIKWKEQMNQLSIELNLPIFYLEDILENKIKSLNGVCFDLDFFKKEKKLNKGFEQKKLI